MKDGSRCGRRYCWVIRLDCNPKTNSMTPATVANMDRPAKVYWMIKHIRQVDLSDDDAAISTLSQVS
jgi:hypothetical protein